MMLIRKARPKKHCIHVFKYLSLAFEGGASKEQQLFLFGINFLVHSSGFVILGVFLVAEKC